MKGRLRTYAFCSGLLLLVSLAFGGGFFPKRIFFFRDLTFYFYPAFQVAWQMIRQGHYPLWNPYNAYGMPLAAMADVMLYYPLTWLRVLLPHPLGFNLSIIANGYIAALATYGLARRLRLGQWAAFTTAAAFALSGPLCSLSSMINVMAGAAWMPVVLLAALWAVEQPSVWRVLVLGAAMGMQAVTGEALFCLAAAVIAMAIGALPNLQVALRVWLPAALFGSTLIAVQLLPAVEMLSKSVRLTEHFSTSQTFWSLNPLNLLETFLPGLLFESGNSSLALFLYDYDQPYLVSLYLGPLTLALAVLALCREPSRQVKGLFLCIGVLMAYGFGRHSSFIWILLHVPVVDHTRFPVKIMAGVALAVALLAGYMVDKLGQEPGAERRALEFWWVKWVLAVAVGLVLRALLAPPGVVAWLWRDLARLLSTQSALVEIFKGGAMVLLAGVAFWLARHRPKVAAGLLAVPLGLDLALAGFFNYGISPTGPVELMDFRSPLVDLAGGGSREFRIRGDASPSSKLLPILEGWSEMALGAKELRFVLWAGAPEFGVLDSRLLSLNELYGEELLLFGTQSNTWVQNCEHARLGARNIRYFITDRTSRLPGARFSKAPPCSSAGLPQGIREVTVLPTLTGQVSVWEILDWKPRVELTGGSARLLDETPNRVRVEAESASGGRLVLRDSYDSGWRVTVDGEPATIERVEQIFRAVDLPPGKHTLDFTYRPWSFVVGATLSAGALLLFLICGIGVIRGYPPQSSWSGP